jgi:hypothetical protein
MTSLSEGHTDIQNTPLFIPLGENASNTDYGTGQNAISTEFRLFGQWPGYITIPTNLITKASVQVHVYEDSNGRSRGHPRLILNNTKCN